MTESSPPSLWRPAVVALPFSLSCILSSVACYPPPDTGAVSDSGAGGDTAPPEPLPYRAEEICNVGAAVCARLDDGRVACWGDLEPMILDIHATRLRCGSRVFVEDASGQIGCYDWFSGEPETESMYCPDPDDLPFVDLWANVAWGVGGAGIKQDGYVANWPKTYPFSDTIESYQAQSVGFTGVCIMLVDMDGVIHSLYTGENCEGHPKLDKEYDGAYGLETPPDGDGWRSVSGGRYHACALDNDGRATCWGWVDAEDMAAVEELRFAQLDSSTYSTCGVTVEGRIACWSFHEKFLPTDIPTSSGWQQVGVFTGGACALDNDGQVTCFGDTSHMWSSLQDALHL